MTDSAMTRSVTTDWTRGDQALVSPHLAAAAAAIVGPAWDDGGGPRVGLSRLVAVIAVIVVTPPMTCIRNDRIGDG